MRPYLWELGHCGISQSATGPPFTVQGDAESVRDGLGHVMNCDVRAPRKDMGVSQCFSYQQIMKKGAPFVRNYGKQ